MNTEYALGNIRICFESRVRRRWFVVLCYAVFAASDIVWFSMQSHPWHSYPLAWIDIGLGILLVALSIVFTWLTDDMRKRGDERETFRREHAYARAYKALAMLIFAACLAGVLFGGPNPITPLLPPAFRPLLIPLPNNLLLATFLLYATLPQAILLWTEPDMDVNPEAAVH